MTTRALILLTLLSLVGAACATAPNIATNSAKPAATSTPTAEKDSAVQTVTIDSPDGVKLVGSFCAAAKADSAALLLLHQWQSDRHSYDDFAKRMQATGFALLSIDGRGFGESNKKADGTTISAGRTEADVKGMLSDVAAAIDFLTKQKNVNAAKIGIVGASYGSSLALIYAADNPKIAAVVLLSPGLNYFSNMPTEPAIKKFGDRPLLLVAAEDDKESADAVRKLKEDGAKDKYQAKIFEKGGHGTGIFQAKVGLDDLLEQFLTKSL